MKNYGYTIPAGGSQVINVPGRYIRGISGTLPYEIQFDDGPATGFETGIGTNESFDSVRITNTAGVAQFIEVAISYQRVDDSRMVGAEFAPKPAELMQGIPALTGGGTIAANADRRELVMVADVANVDPVSVEGLPIQPGDSFTLPVTGAVTVTATAGDVLHIAEVI